MTRYLLPLLAFFALLIFLGAGLRLNPRELPSALIGKPAPDFQLADLHQPASSASPKSMMGRVWVLNVWASWCVACRTELPLLMDLAKRDRFPIVGLNYKDERADGTAWLKQFGDPYVLSVHDRDGRVGIDYGVYGVPETFVIDRRGIIRFRHAGPLTPELVNTRLLPLIRELESA